MKHDLEIFSIHKILGWYLSTNISFNYARGTVNNDINMTYQYVHKGYYFLIFPT